MCLTDDLFLIVFHRSSQAFVTCLNTTVCKRLSVSLPRPSVASRINSPEKRVIALTVPNRTIWSKAQEKTCYGRKRNLKPVSDGFAKSASNMKTLRCQLLDFEVKFVLPLRMIREYQWVRLITSSISTRMPIGIRLMSLPDVTQEDKHLKAKLSAL